MRIVFFSYRGTIGARCLRWLLDQPEAEVAAVVTWPDYVHPEIEIAVKDVLYDTHLPLYQPRDVNDDRFVDTMRALEPDLFVSMYFGKLFKAPLLAVPKAGCVNIHNSILPKYRGQAPSIWAVANGDRETGQTMHYLDEGMDTGDVIASKAIPIEPDDTGYTIGVKLEDLGVQLFQEAFPSVLDGSADRIPQDDSKATWCRAPRARDARIDWGQPARRVSDFVRAFTRPLMGAYSRLGGRTVRIWRARPSGHTEGLAPGIPGDVIAVTAEGPVVWCGEGAVVLDDYQVQGPEGDLTPLWIAAAPRLSFAD